MTNVLMIQDGCTIANFLRNQLVRLNYHVTLIEAGAKAKKLMTSSKFDLVITSCHNQVDEGILQIIQQRHTCSRTHNRTVVITGFSALLIEGHRNDDSNTIYISEPFHVRHFLGQIRCRARRNTKAGS